MIQCITCSRPSEDGTCARCREEILERIRALRATPMASGRSRDYERLAYKRIPSKKVSE